jgi:hypothetical protein
VKKSSGVQGKEVCLGDTNMVESRCTCISVWILRGSRYDFEKIGSSGHVYTDTPCTQSRANPFT